jgi:hypothetical protein
MTKGLTYRQRYVNSNRQKLEYLLKNSKLIVFFMGNAIKYLLDSKKRRKYLFKFFL